MPASPSSRRKSRARKRNSAGVTAAPERPLRAASTPLPIRPPPPGVLNSRTRTIHPWWKQESRHLLDFRLARPGVARRGANSHSIDTPSNPDSKITVPVRSDGARFLRASCWVAAISAVPGKSRKRCRPRAAAKPRPVAPTSPLSSPGWPRPRCWRWRKRSVFPPDLDRADANRRRPRES